MIPVTEAQWQQTVLDLARLCGWQCAHFRPARTEQGWRTPVAADGKGFPDLVLAHPRHGVLFVELKSNGGHLTGEQTGWLDVLEQAGARVAVWRPRDFDQVRKVLDP